MTAPSARSARPVIAGSAILAGGVLVPLVIVIASAQAKPAWLAAAFGGLVLLVASLAMRDQRAYWLFLFVLAIPFDIGKQVSKLLLDPPGLAYQYGPPGSGITSVDIFLSDAVLFAMVLPWLARLCLRRDKFYFPSIGYIFVLYLGWALIVSLIEAKSLYLSAFQWCRDILYFVSFIYLINNVVTRTQFRAIVLALLVGLGIASGSVISFYYLNLKTDKAVYSWSYKPDEASTDTSTPERSSGIFATKVTAAYYLEFTLLIAAAHLVTTQRPRARLLLGVLFMAGCIALYETVSRSGLVGFVGGLAVFLSVARWSRLISARAFIGSVLFFGLAAAASVPLLIANFDFTTVSANRRVTIIELVLDAYWQRPIVPIIGAGLNNSSTLIKTATEQLIDNGRRASLAQSIHSAYIVILSDVGIVGFLLYYTFLGKIVIAALRSLRAAEPEVKILLAGLVGSLTSIAIHNLGDGMGGHSTTAMLWLYAGLIVATVRRVQAAPALSTPPHRAARNPVITGPGRRMLIDPGLPSP
jgi:hypothetical protein